MSLRIVRGLTSSRSASSVPVQSRGVWSSESSRRRRDEVDIDVNLLAIRHVIDLIRRRLDDVQRNEQRGAPRCPAQRHRPGATWRDRPPIVLPHPVRMRVLGAVMVGVFLAALDQTVVGTALPRIITDLGGNDLYTWAFTAYLLTSTISGPLYGKLSDLFGRRPIFLFGIGVFMVGSVLAGLSQEMWQLVAARGIQGLGAGALFPIAMAVIADLFARPSAAATRACSARSSGCRACSARPSAA